MATVTGASLVEVSLQRLQNQIEKVVEGTSGFDIQQRPTSDTHPRTRERTAE